MANIVKDADSVTLTLNNHVFTAFGVGDIITLTPVNAQTSQINSSDGGVTITERTDANVYDVKIMIQKFSEDDVFLNNLINNADVQVIQGSMKDDFTRDGIDMQETWTFEGGSITTKPTEVKNDTDGNAVLEYMIMFRNAQRSL